MRKIVGALMCLLVSISVGFAPSAMSPAGAVPAPVRSLSVTGTAAAMYPDFDPAITRYAVTTDDTTAGTVTVAATTSDPDGTVEVNGVLANGPTQVTALASGDEVTVRIHDSAGTTTYTAIYLPSGFPKLTVATGAQGSFPDLQPGLVAVTLNAFDGIQPSYDAIVDRNGVPVYAALAPFDIDLKQEPNGELTVSRGTTVPGHTGFSLVTLDDNFGEVTRRDVTNGLTDTNEHDGVRLTDGSTILIGYQNDPVTHHTDATIQKLNPNGTVAFQWNSSAYFGETLATPPTPTVQNPTPYFDYAHLNSVVSVENGDIIASFRHLSAAYRIATVAHDGYQPGDVIWKLGGRHSDFTFVNDPYAAGSCGQHTVSELPNGHILVYDNGSDPNGKLCVDPADPLGPGIARPHTRITEYVLNTSVTPHTATLVWSYVPASRFSLFAGSARRMPNTDTLIGWAADTSALATEVNQADQTLWELTTPETTGGQLRYATYRAELITRLKPRIIGPADGTSFLVGDTAPGAACLDWRGVTLPNCSLTGISGGLLDTSHIGQHAWQATVSDGAGNTATVARTYSVVALVRRPDGSIRAHGSRGWRGNHLYGSAVHQTIAEHVRRGHSATASWLVRNDGNRTDSFALRGTAGTNKFRVHYWSGTHDVTRAVVAGTFRTMSLTPGKSEMLRVVVTPTHQARRGTARTLTLRSASVGSSAAVDHVAVRVTALR